jgi:hypothetical protein
MRLKVVVSRVAFGMGLVLSCTTFAEAQATRTWVSGVGDDVNPCSRTAPCKTFAGAISKTATGGYIDVLDPGGFGAITITKSITIEGGDSLAGVVVLGTNAIVVNAAGANVTLRNLDLEGGGTGLDAILVQAAASVHVEKCNIIDFAGNAINLAAGGAGVSLFVSDTSIRHTNGIYLVNGRVTIDNLRAEANLRGVYVSANAIATVRNSYVAGGYEGLSTVASSSILNIENSVITNNVWGVSSGGGGTVRVSNSGILSNSTGGLWTDASSFLVSLGGNTVQGNPAPGAFTSTASKQ